jgi:hypothetical protein
MVDFREIQINGVDNVVRPFDVSKLLGNMIFSHAKDVAEDEFARDVYNNGRVEVTKEHAGFVEKQLGEFNHAAQTAIREAISLD